MDTFKDAHFSPTPSQGNIYTFVDMKLASGSTVLLMATLKRDIWCFEYNVDSASGGLVPTTREVSFTYIPSGAEIISIDAFNKSSTKNEWVIGVTIIKNSNDSDTLETFLNIYSQLEESDDFDIANIALNCQNVKLDYIPYHLSHTWMLNWTGENTFTKQTVFILTGSDNQVHIYKENATDHAFKEITNSTYFPEFTKTPSPTVWVDFLHTDNFKNRLTASACECGIVKFLNINTKTQKIIYNFFTNLGNMQSRVCLYFPKDKRVVPEKFKHIFKETKEPQREKPLVNMIAVGSTMPAMLFKDVLTYGFSDYLTLPGYEPSTLLTTCLVADIDFDNEKEIILGTSSDELLLLKYNSDGKWWLEECREMAAPIISLRYIDVTGDGVKELVVFSSKGVHILQHEPQYISEVLKKKIRALTIPNIDKLKI